MLVAVPRCPIVFQWEDREGNIAAQRQYFNHSSALATVEAGAALWYTAVQGVSNATLRRFTLSWQWEREGPNDAEVGSDVYRRLALFYRNNYEMGAIWLPSGRESLLETEGTYAGVRVAASVDAVADALQLMMPVIDFIRTPEGNPFPSEYVVGGIAR